MTGKVGRRRQQLMDQFLRSATAVGALETWLGDPGGVIYERYSVSSLHTLSMEEMARLEVAPKMHEAGFKRTGFLRRGPSGRVLAFVEAVVLRQYLAPWALFELDSTNTTIGEIVVGRMGGRRETISIEPITEFDQTGAPLCIRIEALLHAVPPGGTTSRPLVAVRERIYEDTLGMRW